MDDVLEPCAAQERGGERAPVPGRAGDRERLVVRDLAGDAVAELVVGHVQRALDVALLPFVVLAHVEEGHVARAQPPRELGRIDRRRGLGLQPGRLPCADPARDEALQTAEPDRLEVPRERARVRVARGQDDDVGLGLDDAEPKTLEDIGRRLGLTRERVRQIETEALKRLAKLREMEAVEL